ncbi:DUF1295 domain-containing protein [Streptomyces seoulensis]
MFTREYSWVDRVWSLVPAGYVAVFAGSSGFCDARLDVMLVLVTLWGARLTFNLARKGGWARGSEDYRTSALRSRMSPRRFQLYNLFFNTVFQHVILLLITLPAWTALNERTPFGVADAVAAALFLVCLAGETVADQQQWDFQQWKIQEREAGRNAEPRFLQTGLFRFSRHPNYFFEQTQWWILAAFGVIAAGAVTWTVLGAALLTALFVGSTVFTEGITLDRYPEYADYQRRTSMVVPWIPRRS